MSFYSIIIPTYNSERTIRHCIESILSQTLDDYELIICDGKSQDATIEICEKFDDPRISIHSEPDNGVYEAMNKAIDLSKGNWLYFLGSDDVLHTTTVLEELRFVLEKTDAAIVYGNVKIVGENSWAYDGQVYMGEISVNTLLEHNICHQSIFYHKRVFENDKRFNTDYKVCSDYDFNLYCASKFKMHFVPITVASFFAGGLSSIASDPSFERDKWMNIIEYFGLNLLTRKLSMYKGQMKNAYQEFFRQKEFKLGILAVITYFYYKFSKH